VIGIQGLFSPSEVLPLMLIASLSTISKTRETAELSLRGIFSSVDTHKDQALSAKLYSLVFSELYIYRDFSEREDQQIQ